MGYGVIGSGVFELLESNKQAKLSQRVKVKRVLDLRSFTGDMVEPYLTHNSDDILNDNEISVIVETMGGLNPAYEYTRLALQRGKSVVTSNKELVSVHGAELLSVARANGSRYLFEASVGGGIPVVRALRHVLLCEDVYQITGILNGTTNYILSEMDSLGLTFAETLKQAQEKGFAEREPSADTEGFDAARKLSILLSLSCGKHVNYSKIPTEGISGLSAEDFEVAKSYDSVIRLMAKAEIKNGVVEAIVAPMLVQKGTSVFAGVNDVYNAIMLTSTATDNHMFYGRGAGKTPTAAAVLGDIAEILAGCDDNVRWSANEARMADPGDIVSSRLLLLSGHVTDRAAKALENVCGGQPPMIRAPIKGRPVYVLPPLRERDFSDLVNTIQSGKGVKIESTLRVFADR
jgi:homoserine dehydrogenase